jgi:hypothetical protein
MAAGDAPGLGERRVGLADAEVAWPGIQKKSLRAAERDRPDVAPARAEWRDNQPQLDPGRLIFIDETWTKTNMAKLCGWGPVGHRLVDAVPHGHWNTSTLFRGAINGVLFLACVEQMLAPTLTRGDIVIMDNLDFT